MKSEAQKRKEQSSPFKPYRGHAGKSVEERVIFAVKHRTRLEILAFLNEGLYTINELAALTDEPRDSIKHHVKELLGARAIELAKEEKVGSTREFYYRAIVMPEYSAEELAEMTAEERQAIIGLVIQHMFAEVMASFWAGTMQADPKIWLGWRWFNLDSQARDELCEEQEHWWARARELEEEATNRRAESKKGAKSIVVGLMGFPRERTAPRPPAPPANSLNDDLSLGANPSLTGRV